MWYPGVVPTLRSRPRAPLFSLVARAAAAHVNPRTRLSHMTPVSGRDWCTRERCRLMMQKSQNFPEFPRKSDGAKGSSTPPRASDAELVSVTQSRIEPGNMWELSESIRVWEELS